MASADAATHSVARLHAVRRESTPCPAGIDDGTLTVLLVSIYASDMGETITPVAHPIEIERLCKGAILQRMIEHEFRGYISRLVRDVYLSEGALEAGLGIEEAFEFWQWFDRRMWPSPNSWDRADG